MRTITDEELQDILAKHKKWLNDEAGGVRADLYGAYLRDADRPWFTYVGVIGSRCSENPLFC